MSEYLTLGGHIRDAQSTARKILDGLRGGNRASRIMDVLQHLHAAIEALHHDPPKSTEKTEAQIEHMVDRFLGWRLPENFQPDGGISFKKTFNDHLPQPMKNVPTGTNLFDATQASAMVRYIIEGMPH